MGLGGRADLGEIVKQVMVPVACSAHATPEFKRAQVNFSLEAVVFKSENRLLSRFSINLPPTTLWRGAHPE